VDITGEAGGQRGEIATRPKQAESSSQPSPRATGPLMT